MKITIPTSFQRLIDINEDPIECRACHSEDTWGDWGTEVEFDEDGSPVMMTMGEAICKTCGYTWRL